MKLTRLEIDGFRCFREKRPLAFKEGRSMCLLAENGRGKSSIADALEFWSTGDVKWTHRDGVGLSALIHLDRNEAKVEVQVDAVGVASRTVSGRKAGPLQPAGPLELSFQSVELPILSHRTMSRFVDKSANDKRTELLEALGLEKLSEFRRGVRSTAQRLKRLEKEAIGQLLLASREWTEELAGESLPTLLQKLSQEAQLDTVLKGEGDLASWKPEDARPSQGDDALNLAREVAGSNQALLEAPVDRWGAAVENKAAAEQRSLGLLLKTGRQLLESSEEDRCPLCLIDQNRADLLQRVTSRAADLVTATDDFAAAEEQLREHRQAVSRSIRAIDAYLVSDSATDEQTTALRTVRDNLAEYEADVATASREQSALPGGPPEIAAETLEAIRVGSLATPTEIGPATLRLARLKGRLQAQHEARNSAAEASGKREAAEKAADIADGVVEAAVQLALDRINEPLTNYYSELVGHAAYSGLKLTYTASRAGGIEFEFEWDGRHKVRPPQKVMSESQLNALGLALFLARLKTDPPGWRTLVLDDVIASFDSVHQTRLIRLLNSEFADWQILLLTHDQQLSRTVIAEAPDWLHEKVVAWTVLEGPSFGSANLRTRLRQKLDAGEPAEELGGLARLAIEQALERPVRKLGLKIRHDPFNVYAAAEYRQALVDGLADGDFPRAEDEVLNRLRTAGSVSNRACHYKDHEPGITEEDLRLLLEDLAALDRLFRCDECTKAVWEISAQGSSRCQCKCGALSCA